MDRGSDLEPSGRLYVLWIGFVDRIEVICATRESDHESCLPSERCSRAGNASLTTPNTVLSVRKKYRPSAMREEAGDP